MKRSGVYPSTRRRPRCFLGETTLSRRQTFIALVLAVATALSVNGSAMARGLLDGVTSDPLLETVETTVTETVETVEEPVETVVEVVAGTAPPPAEDTDTAVSVRDVVTEPVETVVETIVEPATEVVEETASTVVEDALDPVTDTVEEVVVDAGVPAEPVDEIADDVVETVEESTDVASEPIQQESADLTETIDVTDGSGVDGQAVDDVTDLPAAVVSD